jgi:hypothetical protein
MDMYRTFVSVKGIPELWVIDVETNEPFGIAYGLYEYMSQFDHEWELVSIGKLNPKSIDVVVEDIILN